MQQVSPEKFCDWIQLIQSEFAEMPGLHLSKRQAQRLLESRCDQHGSDLSYA